MKTKKNDSKKAEPWRTPIDVLFIKLGLPLTTGNKSGGIVMPAPARMNYAVHDERKNNLR